MSTPVQNPKTFTIGDPVVAKEGVTGFQVAFGQTTGGPYSLVSPVEAIASLTLNADGTYSGTFASLNENLEPGTWFAVAQAVNAAGVSGNSPEVTFVVVPPLPSPPVSFFVA